MNAVKLAQGLRIMLEAIEEDLPAVDVPKAKPLPKPKAQRRRPVPSEPVSEEARAEARGTMAAHGFVRKSA